MKMPGDRCTGSKFLTKRLENWENDSWVGGHDLVRRTDRHGEVLIWRRKCSGFARQRMGPKLLNCCKPERMDTKECGNMLKRIQILEDGESQPRRQKIGGSKGQRKESRKRSMRGW